MRSETYLRILREPKKHICRSCSSEYDGLRIGRHWYCGECTHVAHDAGRKARLWVRLAMRSGVLMPAHAFRCVDCDKWAQCWEHRDYSKPLDIEPTCFSCNHKRGPAIFARAA